MPRKLHEVVCLRANPRSEEYMKRLAHEMYPHAEFVTEIPDFTGAEIVLLYPDSIGLGFGGVERLLKSKNQNLVVLNGRRRTFNLTFAVHKNLLLLRFLEITFLPEILSTPFVLLYGVFLALRDLLRVSINHDGR